MSLEPHSPEELRTRSDDEVAARVIDYTGSASQKAEAEMTRRVIVALKGFKRSADRWALVNAVLALSIAALTLVLVFKA